jgi:hypothetical protein
LVPGKRFRTRAPSKTFANEELPAWKPGILDIHHINTGRGNSSLVICPDGTSIPIDAGAANSPVLDVRSRQGHGLVRVSSPGDRFHVLILDDGDETNRVQAAFGPYTS